jgi:HNH endonuclease/AP2 domain
MRELTFEYLRSILDYDPETGIFTNRITRNPNSPAGAIAGGVCFNGYRKIYIKGKAYYEHRLAFLYMTGEWPSNQVDHVNNDRADNKWCNLREASQSENNANGLPRVGRIEPRGVYFEASRQKWMAQIVVNRQTIYLGRYDTAEAAQGAYLNAANNVYGEFAYHNKPQLEERA